MSNTLEYIISLKDRATAVAEKVTASISHIKDSVDKVSEGANKMQENVRVATSKVSAHFTKAATGSRTFSVSLDGLRDKLSQMQAYMGKTTDRNAFRFYYNEAKKLEQQIKRVEQGIAGSGIGSKLAGWRQDFANALPGGQLLNNPIALAGAAVGGMWTTSLKAMDAGKEKMKMQVLTGSEEIGGALYDNLTKFATDTVFGNELYDMAAQMLANGIKDTDVMPIMKELGDISMGDANKLGSLSLAFAQINGKGKLAGQELLQLINAGFNPLQVISEKTGESMSSLQKRMEKGNISISEVRSAMQMATGPGGKFNNMLEKVANTPYGQLEGLKGQLDQMMIQIGQTFLPIATKLMQFVSWLGEKLGPMLQPLSAILGGLAVGLLAVAAAQWVANLAFLANPVTWIIAGVVALIAFIAYLVNSIEGWGEAWQIVVNNAKLNWDVFTSGAKMTFNNLVDNFMIGINKIKTGWYQFKNAVGIGDKAENSAIIRQIAADTERRKQEITAAKKDFDTKTEALRKGSKNALDALSWKGGSLADAKDSVAGALGIAPPGGIPGASKIGDEESALGKTGKKTAESIATGGTKHNYITLNFKDLIGIQNYSGSQNSASEKAGQEVLDQLLRYTASAITAGS